MAYIKDRMVFHLFVYQNICMADGLNLVFISAWKSGKNPSITTEIANNAKPNALPQKLSLYSDDPKWQTRIPTVMIKPTIILCLANFWLLSLTLEHRTAIVNTDRMLQDLNKITSGQLVKYIAFVIIRALTRIIMEQTTRLNAGMQVFQRGVNIFLYRDPISHEQIEGTNMNALEFLKYYDQLVLIFVQGTFILSENLFTCIIG